MTLPKWTGAQGAVIAAVILASGGILGALISRSSGTETKIEVSLNERPRSQDNYEEALPRKAKAGRTLSSGDQVMRDQIAVLSEKVSRLEGAIDIIKPLLLRKGETAQITFPRSRAADVAAFFPNSEFKTEVVPIPARQLSSDGGRSTASVPDYSTLRIEQKE